MPHGLFQRLTGRDGSVKIVALGALIGTMTHWSLSRREEGGSKDDLFDLRAVFSYVNPSLWQDEDYTKTIVVKLGDKQYRLEQDAAFEVRLEGRSLLMEGVRIADVE